MPEIPFDEAQNAFDHAAVGPALVCPFCGKNNDRSTYPWDRANRHAPNDGDISMCIGCRQFSVFTGGGMGVRPLTDADWKEYENAPELREKIRQLAGTAQVMTIMFDRAWVLQIGAEMARNGWRAIGLVLPSGRLEFVRPSDDGERLETIPSEKVFSRDHEFDAEMGQAEQVAVLVPMSVRPRTRTRGRRR